MGLQSFFSHPAYHFRMTCPSTALSAIADGTLSVPGKLSTPVSAQSRAPTRCRRDITFVVIVDSPWLQQLSRNREAVCADK